MKAEYSRRHILKLGIAGALAAPLATRGALAQSTPEFPAELKLDWGFYSSHTLLIKNKGWLEEAFKDVGTKITWVQSRGSNNSLEFLKVGSTDFAGSAALSAFLARANGVPLKVIYVASWGGSSIIQVRPDSPVKTVAGLKGKTIAVTKGTAPYFTLVRALAQHKLSVDDLKVVNLQHPEGFNALQQGQVDAWVGIDPHTSQAELAGDRAIFDERSWRDGSVFSVSEAFLAKHPRAVERLLGVWVQTQKWIRENNSEFIDFVTKVTGNDPKITELTINKRDWNDPVPGEELLNSIRIVTPLLGDDVLRPGVNVDNVLASLIDPAPAKKVLGA
ncbi:aliphatic sulfonate ABC transporter substrate-binding protein [Agrobacterium pusense]|uniref:aliphatic sulfonate ABC transporter substrate-binding protein n=1 Tax=Agrobacterium pusense TaxID=648995 RepID=UPI00156BD66F|nr:aliphatic sulfonate ABC transporter substrate-binding protein [Agrobacterium pusense]MBW9060805.1 aliphatic sulfonate ABC transporter substrate-binding protein [Agrobacterium pusense]QKJ92585.1 aliphatic sulfonate ABC transporter substrate-binding protein [Agrobacterium pusense]